MPHQRRPGSPRVVVDGPDTLDEVELWSAPAPQWRAAFLRPPPALITADRTPEVRRVPTDGTTVHFRAAPPHLEGSLRRIDLWVGHANPVVAK